MLPLFFINGQCSGHREKGERPVYRLIEGFNPIKINSKSFTVNVQNRLRKITMRPNFVKIT